MGFGNNAEEGLELRHTALFRATLPAHTAQTIQLCKQCDFCAGRIHGTPQHWERGFGTKVRRKDDGLFPGTEKPFGGRLCAAASFLKAFPMERRSTTCGTDSIILITLP